jgi:hypothetical protein
MAAPTSSGSAATQLGAHLAHQAKGLTWDEARRIAGGIARLPELMGEAVERSRGERVIRPNARLPFPHAPIAADRAR